jgi:hypothetical protein
LSTEPLLFVDPSIKAMGWAVFLLKYTNPRDATARSASYFDSGVLRQGKDEDDDGSLEWVDRVDASVEFLKTLDETYEFHGLRIEMPSTYGGHKGSPAAASGAIMKLAFQVASIRSVFQQRSAGAILVPVSRWKGTTPKDITHRRIRKYWNVSKSDHNEMDAIGIGDWYFRKHLKGVTIMPKAPI